MARSSASPLARSPPSLGKIYTESTGSLYAKMEWYQDESEFSFIMLYL
jgi:hypothetical protein